MSDLGGKGREWLHECSWCIYCWFHLVTPLSVKWAYSYYCTCDAYIPPSLSPLFTHSHNSYSQSICPCMLFPHTILPSPPSLSHPPSLSILLTPSLYISLCSPFFSLTLCIYYLYLSPPLFPTPPLTPTIPLFLSLLHPLPVKYFKRFVRIPNSGVYLVVCRYND